MRRRAPLLAALTALALLPGCSLLSKLLGFFHKPNLTFERAELADLNLKAVTVNLHWLLHNDNPIEVPIARIAYNFAVEGHDLVSGRPPNGLKVAPNAASPLDFPARVEFQALAPTIETFLTKDRAHYQASGSVGLNTPIGPLDIPLSYSSDFPVPKLPEIKPMQPVLNSVNFTGAHLTFPIQVFNKNEFQLPFQGLSGALNLSGAQVAASNVGAMNALAAKETRVVNLGVDVNFMQAGLNVANAIRNKVVDLNYRGKLNVGGMDVPVNFNQRFALR